MVEPKDFGKKLREIRKKKKMTLEELGNNAGFTKSYLSIIENGKQGLPQPDTLKRLADGLGVNYELLMYNAGYVDKRFYDKSKEVRNATEKLEDVIDKNLLDWDQEEIIRAKKAFSSIQSNTEQILSFESRVFSLSLEELITYYQYINERKKEIENKLKDNSLAVDKRTNIENELVFLDDLKETLDENRNIDLSKPLDLESIFSQPINLTYKGKTLTIEENIKILQIIDIILT